MKILILGHENCNLIFNLANGFKALNFPVQTAVLAEDSYFKNNHYDYRLFPPNRKSGNKYVTKIDHIIKRALWKRRIKHFRKRIYPSFDLYIFTWQTLDKNFEDLKWLAGLGKKIVFLFIGSDIRWIEAFRQQYPDNSYMGLPNEDWQRKFLHARIAELYCSAIFSVPDQSGLLIRGYYHMFMPLDISKINYTPHCRARPVIIHSPSKRDLKGTSIIIAALENLKKKGIDFEFELIEGMPNHLLIKKFEEADIMIDQLYGNGPGTAASEAMAAGCAVASRFFKEYPLTRDMPMCYIDEHCVEEGLMELITNTRYRKSLVDKSRSFVEQYNNNKLIAQRILDSLERERQKDYDYKPSFFKNNFVLPSPYQYTPEIRELNQRVLEKFS